MNAKEELAAYMEHYEASIDGMKIAMAALLENLYKVEAENLRLRSGLIDCQTLTASQAEALTDKADMIFSQAQTISAQAAIIEAQRQNLDAARNDSKQLAHTLADIPLHKLHSADVECIRASLIAHRSALEGVETEAKQGEQA